MKIYDSKYVSIIGNKTEMLKVECVKRSSTEGNRWNQSSSIRSRECLMALYEICNGKSATQVGRETGRNPQTIMEWVHRYNSAGMEALQYRHTGNL